MDKYEAFTDALKKAVETARAFENTEDGGTCNFDSPVIFYQGMRKKKVAEAIEKAGLRSREWRGCGALIICGGTSGQGNRRTRMAEAMEASLKASGYNSGMYYQMD